MKTVKLTTYNEPFDLQFPQKDGILSTAKETYRFILNDPSVTVCDYWILSGEAGSWKTPTDNHARCPRENVYCLLGESAMIEVYPQDFVQQFYNIITTQWGRYSVPKVYFASVPTWFACYRLDVSSGHMMNTATRHYEWLQEHPFPTKTKLLSIISSNKAWTQGHRDRLQFVKNVMDALGDQVDFFGRGLRTFADKWDVIAPYKYHIAIENNAMPGYWTEKIADPFLANTYVFYYGAPDITAYFPENALTPIDIHDPVHAIQTIADVINAGTWERRQKELREARDLVMGKYNYWRILARILDQNDYAGDPVDNVILPNEAFKNL